VVVKNLSDARTALKIRKKWCHRALISEYLGSPMLVAGHKFDLRVYVLVVSMEPLRVYIYHEGLVRFATQKYTMSSTAKHAHLTNFSLNKSSSNFAAAKELGDTTGYKQSFSALTKHLIEMGCDPKAVWADVHAVCLKTIIASHHHCTPHPGCFQLLGFDVMIDKNLKAWVIEVNAGLSLSYDTSDLDAQIKGNAIVDILNIVGIAAMPPPAPASDDTSPKGRRTTNDAEEDPMLAVRQEFSRHSARPNGWQRVFPLQSSQRQHLPLFRQAGDLTTKLAAVVASNPNFGQGPLSLKDQSKTPPTFVVEPIEGPQLRRQFKVWKKTKKKKGKGGPSEAKDE